MTGHELPLECGGSRHRGKHHRETRASMGSPVRLLDCRDDLVRHDTGVEHEPLRRLFIERGQGYPAFVTSLLVVVATRKSDRCSVGLPAMPTRIVTY